MDWSTMSSTMPALTGTLNFLVHLQPPPGFGPQTPFLLERIFKSIIHMFKKSKSVL